MKVAAACDAIMRVETRLLVFDVPSDIHRRIQMRLDRIDAEVVEYH